MVITFHIFYKLGMGESEWENLNGKIEQTGTDTLHSSEDTSKCKI